MSCFGAWGDIEIRSNLGKASLIQPSSSPKIQNAISYIMVALFTFFNA